MNPVVSIIIPTHRRPQTLRLCLDAIGEQTLIGERGNGIGDRGKGKGERGNCPIEVIVVSDGPDEKTAEMLMNLEWPFRIQYFAIPKSQQGVCRNAGLKKAHGEIVLLIGDDMFLAPDACEVHVRAHERGGKWDRSDRGDRGIAVLGYTTWDPSLKITPLMKWMEKSGVQFGYPKIEKYKKDFIPKEKQHWFTYTSQISLPREVFYKHQFREDVMLYGWEDVEWGKRLSDDGIPLYYEPDAKAFHHHMFTDNEVWERSKKLGESAVVMDRLVPLGVTPKGWKRLAHRIESFLPTYRGRHWRAFFT